MAHVEAAERAAGAAEARGLALLLEEEQPGAGVAAGGEHDAGGGQLPPALPECELEPGDAAVRP